MTELHSYGKFGNSINPKSEPSFSPWAAPNRKDGLKNYHRISIKLLELPSRVTSPIHCGTFNCADTLRINVRPAGQRAHDHTVGA